MKTVTLVVSILMLVSGSRYSQADTNANKLSDNERMARWREARFGMFVHFRTVHNHMTIDNFRVCRLGRPISPLVWSGS